MWISYICLQIKLNNFAVSRKQCAKQTSLFVTQPKNKYVNVEKSVTVKNNNDSSCITV
uniref:Uncharacterized protein n=1 Tax=Anguilla anguilla TaxID=7936 RepID=A0A0E9SMF2_ANGAN